MARSSSKKTAQTPRASRKHGGARAGSGRKRDKLPTKILEELGDPPDKPTALRVWNARVLATVQLLNMRGEISNELASSLRANAGAIDRALPVERPDVLDDDTDDVDDDGPELEEASGDGGIRVS